LCNESWHIWNVVPQCCLHGTESIPVPKLRGACPGLRTVPNLHKTLALVQLQQQGSPHTCSQADLVRPCLPGLLACRFPLPPLSPGVYHLAILPAAAAATAGGATCEAADAGASSSRFEGWDPSSAAPWVLQPLLALPAPAARELQQHWQRLCRAAGASSPQHYQSGSSGSEQSSSQGQGCGAGTGAPHVAAQAKVWRSIWAGLMHDMACAICNTPPTAQPHPHAALVHLRPASPAVPGAGAAGHTDSVPPPASPLQQHQHHQQEQNQLLVKTLRVLLPYLTQVGLAATARHLVEQLAHNSWGMSTNTPPGPSVMAAFTRNTTSTSK
jgi:hypothetical protein